jgi:hypothetical protein
VETDIVSFNDEEFARLTLNIPGLTYDKTKRIFELLQIYNLNFVVVHDRLEPEEHTIEELKEVVIT